MFFEVKASLSFDPTAIVTSCIESGADSLFLDEHSLPADFFDLSSGLAGELLHRLSVYQMRMAAVVSDLTVHSLHFQAFVREANKGDQYRFFSTRQQATRWLESVGE
jgi:PadR family transcriptional regulator AphA